MSESETAQHLSPSPAFPVSQGAVNLDKLDGPVFVITVDTEEEFDWSAPFSRDNHGVSHVDTIPRFQQLCESNGTQPLYLVDYPIAKYSKAAELLGGYCRSGKAEIGLQLHPWVTPPYDEDVNASNSYACNLPPDLERAKLIELNRIVVDSTGVRPVAYRAGRYGASANAMTTLGEIGVHVDTSVRSLFDYSGQGGPNYAASPLEPFWLARPQLIELPLTSVFSGMLRNAGGFLFQTAFQSDAMRSAMARTRMLERIALTPEGIPVDKAIEGIDVALDMGLPVLVFSFHSPSLAAGHTPYVRSEADLDAFYFWWDQVFAHLAFRGVRPSNIAEISKAAYANP